VYCASDLRVLILGESLFRENDGPSKCTDADSAPKATALRIKHPGNRYVTNRLDRGRSGGTQDC
jgi:hypothetical protein